MAIPLQQRHLENGLASHVSLPNGIGASQYNNKGWRVENDRGYRILEVPHGTTRRMRIIFIGAGASGLCFAKFSQDLLKDVELQIYEKNEDVGGTWLENRYPGCACDIPSANYQFTWERKPDWSHFYSSRQEIWQYLRDIAVKYGLLQYTKLRHTVRSAKWDADEGLWHLQVLRPDGTAVEDSCHILINGTGFLNDWKWPEIKGLHSFKGSLQHTASYQENYDMKGKRVAVIGTGSSGVQIIPNIVHQVDHLYTWIRSPTWITPAFAQKFAGKDGLNFAYSVEQKQMFAKEPSLYLKYSKMIESELNQRFKLILKGTPEAQNAKKFAYNDMKTKLAGKEELIEAIIPKDFEVGCRRPTPGNGFLEALQEENVTVFTKMMREITRKGFLDAEGKEHEVDVIVCATGFNTTWIPRFSVEANGIVLSELWAEKPTSYLSLAVPRVPNYFMVAGPYGPLGHGSFLPVVEVISKNIIQVISKMQKERIKSLSPRQDVVDQFVEHADLYLTRTAWSSSCSSWFKQGRTDGSVAMFPGTRLTYVDLISTPRYEDYTIEYLSTKNMFAFLGSGFDVREFDGRDLSYYLGLLDGQDTQIDLEGEVLSEISSLIPQAVNKGYVQ